MAVTVKTLYKNGAFLYKMELLAGKSGLGNPVQWVHRLEDSDIGHFLHGSELVFTAGILNNGENWLLSFARKLHETGASALVVKVGQHTGEISAAVRAYCDEAGLPLFTIPWETKMVDMTRDFCHRIMQAEHTENTVMTTMKNIIFKVGDIETQVLQMERYGIFRDSPFCFVCVRADEDRASGQEEQPASVKTIAAFAAKGMTGPFVTFTYKDCRVLVLVNYSETEIETFVDDFLKLAGTKLCGVSLHAGVSPNQAGIYDQNVNLEKALSAMEMAKKRHEPAAYYDRLGIYRLLYAVNDKAILRSFHYDTVGRLAQYDRENGTRLVPLLREYLQNNGSLQLVAERLFIHRNTVINHLKRIESVTGFDPLKLEDKVKLTVGLYIGEIL